MSPSVTGHQISYFYAAGNSDRKSKAVISLMMRVDELRRQGFRNYINAPLEYDSQKTPKRTVEENVLSIILTDANSES